MLPATTTKMLAPIGLTMSAHGGAADLADGLVAVGGTLLRGRTQVRPGASNSSQRHGTGLVWAQSVVSPWAWALTIATGTVALELVLLFKPVFYY